MMKRILVVGCSGAGKTTLALHLGKKLNLPVYHLDQLWWLPGWAENTCENFDARLVDILKREAWILDGNYNRTLPERLKYADTVILLDYPRSISLWRALKRIYRYYGRTRIDMTDGCPERLDWEFLSYIWNFNRTMRPSLEASLQNFSGTVIRVRNPKDLDAMFN